MRAVGCENSGIARDDLKLKIFERKIYIDHEHKLFCDTILTSALPNQKPVKGGDETLSLLVQDLKSMGYKQAQRRAYDAILRG